MKALVLAGGLGSRLRPLTQTGAKQLLPVGNKPIIHYVLEDIRSAGIHDVGVVVGSETALGIPRNLGDGSQWGLKVTYLHQETPLGLAHCVLVAKEFLKAESFVMYLGDNLLQGGIGRFTSAFQDGKANAQILLCEVRRPAEYGVVEFDGNGRIRRLVEKPISPPSNWAVTGIYFFDRHIMEAASAIRPSQRNELEITDAIQWLLDHDFKVDYHRVPGWWKDTGKPEDLLEANVLVLQDLKGEVDSTAKVDDHSQIIGEVKIGPGVQIRRSVLRGPVIIDEGSTIENAFIGASTSVGAGCVVKNSEVSCSIIMEGATLLDVPVPIDWSLIGKGAVVCRGTEKPRALNLVLGDLSKVELI